MDEDGVMLWGRVPYEMMERYWPAVARGDEEAPPAIREWAVKLEAKPKYVMSSTRKEFPWTNSHHIDGDLRTGVQKLKDATPTGVLLGSGKLAAELDRQGYCVVGYDRLTWVFGWDRGPCKTGATYR